MAVKKIDNGVFVKVETFNRVLKALHELHTSKIINAFVLNVLEQKSITNAFFKKELRVQRLIDIKDPDEQNEVYMIVSKVLTKDEASGYVVSKAILQQIEEINKPKGPFVRVQIPLTKQSLQG